MIDTEKKYSAILKLIKKYENGDASILMQQKAKGYDKNHGVSVPDIRTIAAQFAADNDLANKLRAKNIREHRILADILTDTSKISITEAKDIIASYNTSELAELGAMFFLSKLPFAFELAQDCLHAENDFTLMTGYILFANQAKQNPALNDTDFNLVFEKFKAHAEHPNFNVQKNMARALRNIALRNENLKSKIIALFKDINTTNSQKINYLREEVLALI